MACQPTSIPSATDSSTWNNPADTQDLEQLPPPEPITPGVDIGSPSVPPATLSSGSSEPPLAPTSSGSAPVSEATSQGIGAKDLDDGAFALGLARHLTQIGAKMYGAFWCPQCQEQKAKFGEAFSEVDYVECDPGGENPRTEICLDADIEAFPTWILENNRYIGLHSLAELATLSGYAHPDE